MISDGAGSPPPEGRAKSYSGTELEVFAHAQIWRAYWHDQVAMFIGGRVLEVGAGLGANTNSLALQPVESWLALEPDPNMAGRLISLSQAGALPNWCQPKLGTIVD